MAKWSEAIALLIERLAGYTPERDPQSRFVAVPDLDQTRIDRQFRIEAPASLTFGPTNNGDAAHGQAILVVSYSHRTETIELLQDMGDDAEDLMQRVAYFPGQEWGRQLGYDFWIEETAAMEQDSEGGLLMIPVNFQYNMRD
jgi:hypothetical protein